MHEKKNQKRERKMTPKFNHHHPQRPQNSLPLLLQNLHLLLPLTPPMYMPPYQ